jgi:hypothetical protein
MLDDSREYPMGVLDCFIMGEKYRLHWFSFLVASLFVT